MKVLVLLAGSSKVFEEHGYPLPVEGFVVVVIRIGRRLLPVRQ